MSVPFEIKIYHHHWCFVKLILQHSSTISGHEHAVCYRIYCHLLFTTEKKTHTNKPTENVVVHHVPTQHWHGSLTQQETIQNASICFFLSRSLTNSRFNLWVCVQLASVFFCIQIFTYLPTMHVQCTFAHCTLDISRFRVFELCCRFQLQSNQLRVYEFLFFHILCMWFILNLHIRSGIRSSNLEHSAWKISET